jgi:hypothetical protein
MTPAEFRAAIAVVGLSQQAAGVWFGRSARTGQRWASGEYAVPGYVARFLRYMVRSGLTPTAVMNSFDSVPPDRHAILDHLHRPDVS